MSWLLMLAAAKTMALGGVATGSMKAYEQHTAAGSIRYSGFTFMFRACKSGQRSETTMILGTKWKTK